MTVVVIGEVMLEYSGAASNAAGLRYGGDTLNTAIHMARSGCHVAYGTAVGEDPLSNGMVQTWAGEGLDTSLVLRHPSRHPGIYAIHVDGHGERSFLYWRDQSAARDLVKLPGLDQLERAINAAELLYFSHISVAILPAEGREWLIDAASAVQARGGMVAYDSNYRPRLWESSMAARDWSQRAMAVATIGLPTGDDERLMLGSQDHDAAIADRWLAAGCQEVAVKGGAAGCTLASFSQPPMHSPCLPVTMVDSSGAGDAFNAAYLAAKLTGDAPQRAAAQAHRLAAWVIGRHGALPPHDSDAPYATISRIARTDQTLSSPIAATATSGAVL